VKTIILKDLRENLKVALVGLLVITLLVISSYQTYLQTLTNAVNGSFSGQNSSLEPLLSDDLLNEMTFFCALFGLALGWLQSRNEAHRDLWAFLIHRPLTRTRIFWGKAIAGVCLYSFGAGLPMIVFAGIVITPGHVAAPFEWAMVWPPAFIFLTGLAYYFAGMLTGLRQARWYASRALGVGTAVFATFSALEFPGFWQQFALIGIVTLVLAVSAWGSYQSGGFYRSQSRVGKFSLALVMAGGNAVVLFIAFVLFSKLLFDPASHSPEQQNSYQMTRDGSIYKLTLKGGIIMESVDMNGHTALNLIGRKMDESGLSDRIASSAGVYGHTQDQFWPGNPIQNASYFFRVRNITGNIIWFLDRHGKLTGYDSQTRKLIGNLNAAEPFLLDSPSWGNTLAPDIFPTAQTLYQVDFTNRSETPLFTVTNGEEIIGFPDKIIQPNRTTNWLVPTPKTVYLLDNQGKPILSVPFMENFKEYPSVRLWFLGPTNSSPQRFSAWFEPNFQTNRAANWTLPIQIQWFGDNPANTKITSLPTVRRPEYILLWEDKLGIALVPPSVILKINGQISGGRYWSSILVAAFCAVVVWPIGRRYNFSPMAQLGWAGFVLLTGIPGLLAFFCVQEWPAREPCPQCKKLRTVDRETCEHCGAPFPAPEKTGTEIFAPLETTPKQ